MSFGEIDCNYAYQTEDPEDVELSVSEIIEKANKNVGKKYNTFLYLVSFYEGIIYETHQQ